MTERVDGAYAGRWSVGSRQLRVKWVAPGETPGGVYVPAHYIIGDAETLTEHALRVRLDRWHATPLDGQPAP